ncbi:unnamed protein product [Albugo candida]|uniref:Uncharacterized protein n=1 Tax=Albugo candida TaxID=65357 RepID=A0A024FVM2_9STRA|nr:unnamed protein product [Albugo candida]|eukprot:CCI11175.1 unnamed protein product [Albugo candida]
MPIVQNRENISYLVFLTTINPFLLSAFFMREEKETQPEQIIKWERNCTNTICETSNKCSLYSRSHFCQNPNLDQQLSIRKESPTADIMKCQPASNLLEQVQFITKNGVEVMTIPRSREIHASSTFLFYFGRDIVVLEKYKQLLTDQRMRESNVRMIYCMIYCTHSSLQLGFFSEELYVVDKDSIQMRLVVVCSFSLKAIHRAKMVRCSIFLSVQVPFLCIRKMMSQKCTSSETQEVNFAF